MFENIKISELDPEELEMTRQIVQNTIDICDNFLPNSTGGETQALTAMRSDCQEVLQRINFDVMRRGIAYQAAAAARKRQPQRQAAVNKLERLLATKFDYDALNKPGNFGNNLEQMRLNRLNLLRETLQRSIGANVGFAPRAENYNWRLKKIASYLATFDENSLYDPKNGGYQGFRSLVKNMRRDVTHLSARAQQANKPKSVVSPEDLAVRGISIKKITPTTYKGMTIPYAMDFDVTTSDQKTIRIEVPGLTGGSGAPMTKHLKEYLDSFGNEASAYDAINYCRSWLADFATLKSDELKTSASNQKSNKSRLYGKSQLRWEFIMSFPPKSSAAAYKLHHIVAKGIMNGTNHFNS